MAITLPTAATNEYADISVEELEAYLKKDLPPAMTKQIQAELQSRKTPRAFITVTLLRNTRVKPVSSDPSQANLVRVQGTLEHGEITNWDPTSDVELTYGFGKVADTAKIPVFLVITRDELARIPLATSNQVRMEVSFTKAPSGKGQYVLVPSKIDRLETRNVPEMGSNQTKKIWVSTDTTKPEFWGDQAPDETYHTKKTFAYGNVNVISVLECQMINLAVLNSEPIEDPLAWIKQAEADQRSVTERNLEAYNAKRDAARMASMTPTSGGLPSDAEALLKGVESPESILESLSSEGE